MQSKLKQANKLATMISHQLRFLFALEKAHKQLCVEWHKNEKHNENDAQHTFKLDPIQRMQSAVLAFSKAPSQFKGHRRLPFSPK